MSFSMSRRGLLTAGLAAAAAPGLAHAKGGYPWPLGVQLWSVNAEIQQDFDGTLRKLAALGYQRVESAGLHGHTPEAFRKGVEAAGLRCDSAHVSMPALQADPAGQRVAQRFVAPRQVRREHHGRYCGLRCRDGRTKNPCPRGVERFWPIRYIEPVVRCERENRRHGIPRL